jgi:hypothetical protein
MGVYNAMTDVPGIKVGHFADEKGIDTSARGSAAAGVVGEAMVRAIQKAEILVGVAAAKDIGIC